MERMVLKNSTLVVERKEVTCDLRVAEISLFLGEFSPLESELVCILVDL